MKNLGLIFFSLLFINGVASAQGDSPEFLPRSIPAFRASQPPKIDGKLDDPCWQVALNPDEIGDAPKATNFVDQLLDTPVADQTVAYLLYDNENIYVAFYCYDSQPEKITARETKRDGGGIWADDWVAVDIDPFHTHQERFGFIVNAIGTQYTSFSRGKATQSEWKGDWKAAVSRVSDGWTVEILIPFSIIEYPATKEAVTAGLNFNRVQYRTAIRSYWSNIGSNWHYENDGHWEGVIFPATGSRRRLSVMAYTFAGVEPKVEDARNGEGKGVRELQAGLDAKYPITSGLTAVASVNPDFSNVEQEVETIDFSYQERWYPDRRPFFQEGGDIFSGDLFYSRRIPQFDFGAKFYGRVGKTTLGFLDAVSLWERAGVRDFWERNDLALSLKQDLWETSKISAQWVRRDDSEVQNQVFGIAPTFRLKDFSLGGGFQRSWTEGKGGEGSKGTIRFGRIGVRAGLIANLFYMTKGFTAADGFIPDPDHRGASANGWYQNEWREGRIRFMNTGFFISDIERYDGKPYRSAANFWLSIVSRNDYQVMANANISRYEPYEDWTVGLQLNSKIRDRYHNYGVRFAYGRQQDADYRFIAPYMSLRPIEKFSMRFSTEFLRHRGRRWQHVLQLNYDITSEIGLGGRFVYRDGKLNAFLTYRQVVHKGVDAFLILGDPNAEETQKRGIVKLILPF